MSVIVITGASGGIGSAAAEAAALQGYTVAVNYLHNRKSAEKIVNAIREQGGEALTIQADVSTETGAKKLFETVDQKLGTITALFANAGIIHKNYSISEYTVDQLEEIWRTNITSQFLCCREAVIRMSTNLGGRGGAIVLMSSAASRLGGGPLMAYAASKGATDTLTIGLAQEVAQQGIRVNAVRPGLIDTKIHHTSGDLNRLKNLVASVPMSRIGSPEEVANAVLWLLSDQASYITGSILDISGGR